MKKVLILSLHYLDENLGGPNCSKAYVKALATIYPGCTLIYPEHNDTRTDTSFLQGLDIRFLPCRDKRSRLTKLLDFYRGKLHRFLAPVREELARNRYDIIFLNTTFIASSGVLEEVLRSGSRVVTLHHNVEKDYLRDNPQPLAFRLPYNHFYLRAEAEAIKASHLNLTLTDSDRRKFQQMFPDRRDSFETMGMFEFKPIAAAPAENTPKENEAGEHTFVISGSLDAQQTETALLEFLRDYLPALLEVCPDARLTITGRNPSPRLQQACQAHPAIQLVPNPADFFGEIAKSAYYIAPINTGSGLKLRVMDPLRLGLPVLAHEVSARGYERLAADGCLWSYDSPATFRESLRQMLAASATREHVVRSYRQHFSPEAGRLRLQEILSRRSLL